MEGRVVKIKILSDSACDLPEDIIKEYDIDILPIIVLKNEEEYLDKVGIEPQEVYDGMREGQVYKTAQISLATFMKKFEEYAEKEIPVIYLAFSSELSGTYQTALMAMEATKENFPKLDLHIIDTKAASGGFGYIVLEAAKLAKEGKSKEEILEAIDFHRENIQHIFTVDDMEYLFRGGRVTRTQAFVGGLLNIKPILHVEDGRLVPLEKVRGRAKVYKKIIDLMEDRLEVDNLENQTVIITHGDNLEGAEKLKELIKERFKADKFIINTIGAAIGAHSGPGTLALFFLKRGKETE